MTLTWRPDLTGCLALTWAAPDVAGPCCTRWFLSRFLVTQDQEEKVLNTNLHGNFTLESVQRNQSGTYGCRVLDYDAADEAELSQTLELRVACESPRRTCWGALALAASSPHPQSCLQMCSPCLDIKCLPPGDLAPVPSELPHQAAREPFPK